MFLRRYGILYPMTVRQEGAAFMYQVAICDDNINDGQHTLALAKQILLDRSIEADFSLFTSPRELLEDINQNSRQFDLLLLDILMGKTNGIQLAQALRNEGSRAALIYTTSSRDYALDGYKVQANDYLLKPIEKDTLDASIGRILKHYDNLLVEIDGMLKSISISEIRYAEASANYVILRTANHEETARLRATLSETLGKLGKERFARCHKGYLVNLEQIREVRATQILLHDGSTIPLGRQYRAELQKNILAYIEKAIPR